MHERGNNRENNYQKVVFFKTLYIQSSRNVVNTGKVNTETVLSDIIVYYFYFRTGNIVSMPKNSRDTS